MNEGKAKKDQVTRTFLEDDNFVQMVLEFFNKKPAGNLVDEEEKKDDADV